MSWILNQAQGLWYALPSIRFLSVRGQALSWKLFSLLWELRNEDHLRKTKEEDFVSWPLSYYNCFYACSSYDSCLSGTSKTLMTALWPEAFLSQPRPTKLAWESSCVCGLRDRRRGLACRRNRYPWPLSMLNSYQGHYKRFPKDHSSTKKFHRLLKQHFLDKMIRFD